MFHRLDAFGIGRRLVAGRLVDGPARRQWIQLGQKPE
jgi:hypothetical protein